MTDQPTATPAGRLLAAADLLDKRAGEATKGDWVYLFLPPRWDGDRPDHWVRYEEKHDDGGETSGTIAECPWGERDARYIATMHPEVGKALAAWLRLETRYSTAPNDLAVALADLLLAGES